MIDAIRLINLDRSPERLARFTERHPDVPLLRVRGVEGASVDRDAAIAAGIFTADNEYKPGAIGCALSHLGLWRECAAGDRPFHVAEDDVTLRADFVATAGAVLDAMDDWDVVLWTHNLDWPAQMRPAPGLGVMVVQYDHQTVDWRRFRLGTQRPILLPLVSGAGTACYSVSPRGAARMLAKCLPIGNRMPRYLENRAIAWINSGIDIELSRHYDGLAAYGAMPPLAMSDNDHRTSTVQRHLEAMHAV